MNYGLLLWLPLDLRARGISVAASDALLAEAALLALPSVAVTAWLYHRWSTKRTLIAALVLTAVGLLGLTLLGPVIAVSGRVPILLITALMIGSGGVIAVLPPFTSESCAVAIRGRGNELIAAASKAGGIAAQVVSMAALVRGGATAAVARALPVGLAAVLAGQFGPETRGRRLEEANSWRPSLSLRGSR
jgi:MFS transporter, putative metabolite:H+ symporter